MGNASSTIMLFAPYSLVEYLILPTCILVAIMKARRRSLMGAASDSQNMVRVDSEDNQVQEMFGLRDQQFAFTVCMLCVSAMFGTLALSAGVVHHWKGTSAGVV